MMYNPDRWVILEFNSDAGKVCKVFAGWRGGYLDGDSWKLNSGITTVKDLGDTLEFLGESGSAYRCHKEGYGMTSYMFSIFSNWEKQIKESETPASMEVIDYDEYTKRYPSTVV